MRTRYLIPDEPRPSKLTHLTVNPTFPLLTMMLGGSWLGLPWFIINGKAMGSPSFRRELAIALLIPICAFGMVFLCVAFGTWMEFPQRAFSYYLVVAIGTKLAGAYWIFTLQNRAFAVYQYAGGPVRNGVTVLILAAMAKYYLYPSMMKISPLLFYLVM